MIQIYETKEYDKFRPAEFNRDVKKTKGLERSMLKHGFLSPYPLHVSRDSSGKFVIKAGNHRFFVARKLGIPVKYTISDDASTIDELEDGTNPYSLQDYLAGCCRAGKTEYIDVQKYVDESGIGISQAVGMLAGWSSSASSKLSKRFKHGEFNIDKSVNHALKVKNIILYMKKCGVGYASVSSLVKAISRIVLVDEFNEAQFLSRVKKHTSLFERKASVEQYMDLLEIIYNHTSKVKIPLKFLAEEAARKRKCIIVSKTST